MGLTDVDAAVSVRPVSSPRPSDQEESVSHQRPRRDVRGAFKTIAVGVALPCLIIITVITVLLAIIFARRVNGWTGHPELTPVVAAANSQGLTNLLTYVKYTAGPAYLVNENPSTLTTIAQWTGKVTPYLTSSIMALVAFFAARYIVVESKKAQEASLPTPEQLSLLINLLGGNNFDPLIDTASFWWQTKRRLPAPIPAAFWSLFTVLAVGLLIPVVDTWFGAATRAVPHVQFSNQSSTEAYGRQLDEQSARSPCANGPSNDLADYTLWSSGSSFWPCSVEILNASAETSGTLSLSGPIDALKMQHNINTSTSLGTFTHNSNQYFFYTDPRAAGNLDFQASSPAISTQCVPMTQKCLNSSSDRGFVCSPGFSGSFYEIYPNTLYTPPNYTEVGLGQDTQHLGIGFSTTADLLDKPHLVNSSDIQRNGTPYPSFVVQNPQYFGTWALDYPDATSLAFSDLQHDPDVIKTSFAVVWFLNCTTIVANATYTFVNGSISNFNPVPMDAAMATLFTSPFSLFHAEQVIGTSMVNMATLAAVASNSTELAHTWAVEFSKTALSLANGVFVPLVNTLQQDRTNMIVAQVPKIPLFILILLKLIYVVVVIALAIGAYAFTHPAETEVVKKQLSTKGLAAAYFDTPGLLQGNAVSAITELASPAPDEKPNPIDGKTTTPRVNEVEPASSKVATAASPADLKDGAAPKVGLVADAQGAWTFAVKANGVWHTIRPIVNLFIDSEVRAGDLSTDAGNILKSL